MDNGTTVLDKHSQQQTILRRLWSQAEVPLPVLSEGIKQYNARIKELREKGYGITLCRDERVNGVRHTAYKLEYIPS